MLGQRPARARRSTSARAARRTTPTLAGAGRAPLGGGRKVFAGQRADAFHVDLGSIFDLGALRPFNEPAPDPVAERRSASTRLQGLQRAHASRSRCRSRDLTRDGNLPDRPDAARRRSSASGPRRAGASRGSWTGQTGKYVGHGPWEQVSRLGNPLFNEVIVPMAEKDKWNARPPSERQAATRSTSTSPELARLLPVLYPGVFPNLATYTKPRADLNAILLTGIPTGVVPGFQNYTGAVEADMLRLNVAIPPSASPNHARPGRGRRGRLPQRAPGRRRRGDDRAAGDRRPDDPAGRPVVHAGRRGQRGHRRDDEHQRRRHRTRSRSSALPGGGYQTKPGTTAAS